VHVPRRGAREPCRAVGRRRIGSRHAAPEIPVVALPLAARRRGPPGPVAACGGGAPPPASPGDATGDDGDTAASKRPRSPRRWSQLLHGRGVLRLRRELLPAGWYCDLGVRGGPACSFVPECETRSNCACVTAVLGGGCRCDERDGGAYVTCD
jgi:hypothetical protein